jgi:hypothetical protein
MSMNRKALYGLVHKGANALLGIGKGSDDDDRRLYEDWIWQQTRTGERGSQRIGCADLDYSDLSRLVDMLRAEGALDGTARGGLGPGAERPTPKQWAAIAAMSRARDWAGLEDPRLQKFCYRTCRVSHTRFLDRKKASALITGLQRWEDQDAARASAA